MKQINVITAILLAMKEFGINKFSIYNITISIREHLNSCDYILVEEDGSTYNHVEHNDIKKYFEELWDNGLLPDAYNKTRNPQGYREYQWKPELISYLNDTKTSVSQPTDTSVNLTVDDIKDACASSGIPFDIQKKMYLYIKNNSPVSMKQIQSRLKAPYTCVQLRDFLNKIGLIDPNTLADYPSHAKTKKFVY